MRREVVNMSDINPYDGTHFENPSDWEVITAYENPTKSKEIG